MLIKNTPEENEYPQRSNLAWDKTKLPRKSILKQRSKSQKNIEIPYFLLDSSPNHTHLFSSNINDNTPLLIKHTNSHVEGSLTNVINNKKYISNTSKSNITIPPNPFHNSTTQDKTNETNSMSNICVNVNTAQSMDIQNLMDKLSINNNTNNTKTIIKANKLYKRFDESSSYNNSTSFTIRYGISQQRINSLKNNTSLVNVMDIFDLPTMLNELLKHKINYYETNTEINDFFCNAYWLVALLDTIITLVFDKMNINYTDEICYDPCRESFKDCSNEEHTHILKEQLSVCEWITTTIGPNYEIGEIPYQIFPLLISELKKTLSIITCENSKWLSYVINLLC